MRLAHQKGPFDRGFPVTAWPHEWRRGESIALGRQITVADLNGDGRPDPLLPSKHSFWVLFNQGRE